MKLAPQHLQTVCHFPLLSIKGTICCSHSILIPGHIQSRQSHGSTIYFHMSFPNSYYWPALLMACLIIQCLNYETSMRREIDDCSFCIKNDSLLINSLPFNGTALQDMSSWMLHTEFWFKVLFLRHLSLIVWMSKKQYFIIRNQPCFLSYLCAVNCFWTTSYFLQCHS